MLTGKPHQPRSGTKESPGGSSQATGGWAEGIAADHLISQGLRLVARNVRYRMGELDLILYEGRCLVFVEVRYRQSSRFGLPAETVGHQKQRRLRAAATRYLQNLNRPEQDCRFDLVAISGPPQTPEIVWIQNVWI